MVFIFLVFHLLPCGVLFTGGELGLVIGFVYVCVCVCINSLCRSSVCSSLWQELFVIRVHTPCEGFNDCQSRLIYGFFLDKLNLQRLHEGHVRILISVWSRKLVGLILMLGQQKAPGSHAWTFPPFPPLEDDWHQNFSKGLSLSPHFSQQRLLVGDLSRPPWLLMASANQLDAGGRKDRLCRPSSSSCIFSCVGNSLEQVSPQSSCAMRSTAEFREGGCRGSHFCMVECCVTASSWCSGCICLSSSRTPHLSVCWDGAL